VAVLTLLRTGSPQGTSGLSVAAAHLQHAMTHLNSAARLVTPAGDAVELEALRSIVYALNDLLIDVAALNRRLPITDEVAGSVAQKCPPPASIRNVDTTAVAVRAAGRR
jgi:hypothetical protein